MGPLVHIGGEITIATTDLAPRRATVSLVNNKVANLEAAGVQITREKPETAVLIRRQGQGLGSTIENLVGCHRGILVVSVGMHMDTDTGQRLETLRLGQVTGQPRSVNA